MTLSFGLNSNISYIILSEYSPSGVNIPENFKYLNNAEMFDKIKEEKLLYSGLEGETSKCTECGQCEENFIFPLEFWIIPAT